MKKSRKFIMSILLMILLTACIFAAVSCSGDNAKTETPDSNPISTLSPNESSGGNPQENTAETRLSPNLPDPDYTDFNGYKFTFLSHRYDGGGWAYEYPHDILMEEETNPTINDAVYKRNDVITNRYNFEIELISSKDYRLMLTKSINSNYDLYDAVLIFNNDIQTIVPANHLVQTHELPYIDEDMPWWDPAVRSLSIAGVNCLLGGDLLTYDNDAVNALIFNKKILERYALESPYAHVLAGTWTFDKLNEMVKSVYENLGGGDTISYTQDRFGFLVYPDTLHALFVSGGGTLAMKDENDIPYMTMITERNLAVTDKALDIMLNKQNVANVWNGGATEENPMYNWFADGRALFLWVRMYELEKLRGMEEPFGVVPLPKYDEKQEEYYSPVNPYTGILIGVPRIAEDLDRTSIVLEALSAESRYTLKPAYYDVALTRKYTRDDESNDMLDIIFNSRVYDIGAVYSFAGAFGTYMSMYRAEDRNSVSLYEKNETKMQAAIDKLVKVFESRQ